ncbi:MAG: NADH-quinone oxidoreductase subunit C [Ignavibacteria bacterium]
MKTREEIFNSLKQEFPRDVLEFQNVPVEPVITVNPLAINKICHFLRDVEGFEFDTLMCLSGIDDANGEKITEADGTVTIKGGVLSVYYHLYSIKLNHKVTLKVSASRENPEVESVESIWKCADWHEREAYDMFGFIFLHHPDLRRILMPYDWEAGYPLRKDYKNPEFYQGIKIPY